MAQFVIFDTDGRARFIAEAADKGDADLHYLRQGGGWYGRCEPIDSAESGYKKLLEVAAEAGFVGEAARAFAGPAPYASLPVVHIPHQEANPRYLPGTRRQSFVATPLREFTPQQRQAAPRLPAVPAPGVVRLIETSATGPDDQVQAQLVAAFKEAGYAEDVALLMARD